MALAQLPNRKSTAREEKKISRMKITSLKVGGTRGKMAPSEDQQQAHRPGAFKQKNKSHKHGKHRTKGEIGRENKGEIFAVLP